MLQLTSDLKGNNMFIRDVKTLADFAVELTTLNELLADPKNLKKLSKELEGAYDIIAKRDEVLKDVATNNKILADIEKGKAEIEAAKKQAEDNLAQSEAIKASAQAIMQSAERAASEADTKLKAAKELEAKNAVILKKSEDKSAQLGKKTAEVDAKSALLDESISRYNDAVSKLSQVKVA